MAQKFDPLQNRLVANPTPKQLNTVWKSPEAKPYPRLGLYAENVKGMFWYNRSKVAESKALNTRPMSTATTPTAAGGAYPIGAKLPNGLVMGEYGPYDPKIKAIQEAFARNKEVTWLKRGGPDRIIANAMKAGVFVSLGITAFNIYIICFAPNKK